MTHPQPFSWRAGLLFVATGGGLLWYFEYEKERMKRKRVAEATKGVGRPKVGGPFELIDQYGKTVTAEDLKGRYSLVSHGASCAFQQSRFLTRTMAGLLWLLALPRHLP